MDNINKKDLFGRPINTINESPIYEKNGQLKEIFKPKVIKHNKIEKPFIKRKDKKDKFM